MKGAVSQIWAGLLSIVLGCVIILAAAGADAAESESVSNPAVTARLISAENGIAPDAASVSLGLALEYGEGWKGYWRTPGEVGLAPEINWSGSTNLKSAELLWPAPERFEAFGIENFGYSGQVVLPIRARLEDAGQPLELRARVSLLTCSTVCVPHDFELSLALPQGVGIDTNSARQIATYADRVPAVPENSDIRISVTALDARDSALIVVATSDTPFDEVDVFPEFGPLVTFGKPDIRLDRDKTELWAQIPINAWTEEHAEPSVTIADTARAITAPITLTSDPPAPPFSSANPRTSLLKVVAVAAIAFLGGLILNVMPCVLPVLSIKLTSVLKATGQTRQMTRNGFLFSALGVLAFVWALAAVLLFLQWIGVSVGWGMQFQNPVFVTLMFMVITVFAANLFGAFEITLPAALQDRLGASNARAGYISDFGTGLLAAILATPCSAPFLGTAITFALAGTSLDVIVIFTALGLGLALPYLVIAARPELVTRLPRPGRWMLLVRILLGGLLLATAAWLLFVLVGVAGGRAAAFITSLTAVFIVAASIPQANQWVRRAVLSACVFLAIFGAGLTSTPDRTTPGVDATSHWQDFEPLGIARRVSEGETVFVDVTADWCLTCKANKSLVLDRDPVRARLRGGSVIAMQADWTRPDDNIARFLERYDRYGIPFNIVFGPGSPSGIALPEILTPQAVLDALDTASVRSLVSE
ncbi:MULTISPECIES: protein-disulfide reductase DsbD [Roseobacter]|uniref:Thioredoxin family protein n=1 Tax=Roseobacter sinensis TaxID=2931391 RepID=A0ABT3BHY9_9RHOB|nr:MULTISPECIES: protein-disulfide reductase DsbD domain-containing protein [Roseobacter]MCV3273195.1 thioredoxin family protein [Roseobacter sp. WL0113]GIT88679.1 suppressor for copper-sensitivity B [Roseobacter sp. OBYS 0001]